MNLDVIKTIPMAVLKEMGEAARKDLLEAAEDLKSAAISTQIERGTHLIAALKCLDYKEISPDQFLDLMLQEPKILRGIARELGAVEQARIETLAQRIPGIALGIILSLI